MKIIPNGLCIEPEGIVRVWDEKLKPGYFKVSEKIASCSAGADESDIRRIEYEANIATRARLEDIRKRLYGEDEAQKEIVACALLNLLGTALLEGDITDLVMTEMSANPKGCYLSANAYITR